MFYDEDGYYETAQVCLNGHVITGGMESNPETTQKFCSQCGQSTISNCPHCKTPIRGFYIVPDVHFPYQYLPPNFCHECGKSLPWTEARLTAAKELIEDFEDLSSDEKSLLKGSLDDIVSETPKTSVSTTRFKKIIGKSGKELAGGLKTILVDVATEAAKKVLWPSP
jgi:hypothetical protein